MIARGKLLDLKHKVLEAAYDHYGADLGLFVSRIAKSTDEHISNLPQF